MPSVRLEVEVAPSAEDEACDAAYAWLELYAICVTLAAVAFAAAALLLGQYIWKRRRYVLLEPDTDSQGSRLTRE